MLMKSGGKFNNDKLKMDMKTYLSKRKKESDKPMGMSDIGPTNHKKKSSMLLLNSKDFIQGILRK